MEKVVEFKSSSSHMRKILIFVLAITCLLVVTVTTLSVLLILTRQVSDDNYHYKNICTSSSCIKAAGKILDNMDDSVDPCENFYQFTCGSFVKNNRIQDDQSKLDEFTILRDRLAYKVADLLGEPIGPYDTVSTSNAKKLYASCMDEWNIELKSIGKLYEIINNEFDGWPILRGNSFNPESKSILEKLIALKKVESSQLFEVYVSLNPKNPKKNVLRVSQPEWFFNKEYLYDDKVMLAYRNLMQSVIQYLNPNRGNNITQQIFKIFKLERDFGILQLDEDQKRNLTYQNLTVSELEKLVPLFEWRSYLTQIFQNFDNITIDENETILVDDLKYLIDASKLYDTLKKTDKEDLENLLVWLFVKETIAFLPRPFQEAKLDFDKVYEGNSVKQSRSLSCSNFVNSKMEYAVGRLYVSRYFNSSSKEEAVKMINNLIIEFKKILNESDWMDEESKQTALEKVDLIDSKIGYSELLYNNTYLDHLYRGYDFKEEDLLENYFNFLKYNTRSNLAELRKDQDPKNWISGPAVVNAFYSPTSNQICFPAGILQPPFYDISNPKYLNYGGIGTVIGHEITHGFDDLGRLYDKNGVYHSDQDGVGLWTNRTVQNYKTKAQCIIEQYNNYEEKQVNKTLNGVNTQGENIADNGGLKESFRAYKSWASKNIPEPLLPGLEKYNQYQMFFISYGQLWCGKTKDQALLQAILNDPHSPGEFRIIGSTSNFEEFSSIFKCKPNQKNNPAKKCSVW